VIVACRKPKTRSAADESSPRAEGRQHHGDLLRRGFQTIQRRVAPGREGGAARLTAKRLDRLGMAMLAVPNQCMDVSIGVAEVRTLLVGAGVAVRVDTFGSPSPTFHFTPGAYWCRGRFPTGWWSAGETAGEAIVWAAGLEQTGEPAALGPAF
jgi:hypothetical protein